MLGLISKVPMWVPVAMARELKMLVQALIEKNDEKTKKALLELKRTAKYEALGKFAERWESSEA